MYVYYDRNNDHRNRCDDILEGESLLTHNSVGISDRYDNEILFNQILYLPTIICTPLHCTT